MLLALSAATLIAGTMLPAPSHAQQRDWALAIHGGAGVAAEGSLSTESRGEIEAVLHRSLAAGEAVLRGGGDSVAAVDAAVRVMEDSPLFNAGRGGAMDETGTVRHDAAIMRGRDHAAGGVAGSTRIRNPIGAARLLMEEGGPVLLAGDGADRYAADRGIDLADALYFQTEARRRALIEQRKRDSRGTDEAHRGDDGEWFGTVGAVAIDREGNLAAATSTGGRTNKVYGRVGDTPLIGAGTYASNQSCAVSATGHGEYFIRWTIARDICARVEHRGETIDAAARSVIDALGRAGGDGAAIAIDTRGDIAFAMNGRGMYRGSVTARQPARVAVYRDEAMK